MGCTPPRTSVCASPHSHLPPPNHLHTRPPACCQAALECLSFCDYSLAIKSGVRCCAALLCRAGRAALGLLLWLSPWNKACLDLCRAPALESAAAAAAAAAAAVAACPCRPKVPQLACCPTLPATPRCTSRCAAAPSPSWAQRSTTSERGLGAALCCWPALLMSLHRQLGHREAHRASSSSSHQQLAWASDCPAACRAPWNTTPLPPAGQYTHQHFAHCPPPCSVLRAMDTLELPGSFGMTELVSFPFVEECNRHLWHD